MTNPSNQTNPLDYPQYVRGIRPALPDSLGDYVDTELDKLQSSMENMAVAADANTKTQVSTLQVTVDANTAAITDEQNARISGDNALASDVTTLQTTVNNNTATITTTQESVDGLKVRYGVSLDANGYVTGFVQNNDGQRGTFTISTDDFSIVPPNAPAGAPGTAPFEVVDGVVQIKEAQIGTLKVDHLDDGTVTANVVQNGDWKLGTGHIIFDNGTYMKVQGIGFGSNNQFIEWFGPSVADFTQCTEANSISYLKTDGSAYFGGTLNAGTITNSTRTTLASQTSLDLGPFSSSGHNINASFTGVVGDQIAIDSQEWIKGDTPPPDPWANNQQQYSITYVFEYSTDGLNYTNIGTYTVNFSSTSRQESAGIDTETGDHYMHWVQVFNSAVTKSATINVGAISSAHVRVRRTAFTDTTTGTAMTPAASSLQVATVEQ